MSAETAAGALLRAEIESTGPLSFERFMEVALYHPACGYYRTRDPFGRAGDFYTAAQLQPAFGLIIRAVAEDLNVARTFLDLGAGRREMASAFPDWEYRAVDIEDDWPSPFRGLVFANELFDALPVRIYDARDREVKVDWNGARFVFTGEAVREECPRAAELIHRIASVLVGGAALILDYGYRSHERERRFPRGSLLSYRQHAASSDVLDSPGERDITAHVDFDSLDQHAAAHGFDVAPRCSLRQLILELGEERVAAIAGRSGTNQLKTLLIGMGETFEALRWKRTDDLQTLTENRVLKS